MCINADLAYAERQAAYELRCTRRKRQQERLQQLQRLKFTQQYEMIVKFIKPRAERSHNTSTDAVFGSALHRVTESTAVNPKAKDSRYDTSISLSNQFQALAEIHVDGSNLNADKDDIVTSI